MSVSIIIQLLKSNLFSWWCEVYVSHYSIWLRDHLEIYGWPKMPGMNNSGQILGES